jgi:hypothetical protein
VVPGSASLVFGGYVFVSVPRFSPGAGLDFATLLYDPVRGSPIWGPVIYDSGADRSDYPTATASDPSGNLYVAGYSNSDVTIVKYTQAGVQIWVSDPIELRGSSGTQPASLALGASGDLVLVGNVASDSEREVVVAKLSGQTGALLWFSPVSAGGSAEALPTVSVAGNGDAIVSALVTGGNESHPDIWRYRGADGQLAWGPYDPGDALGSFPSPYLMAPAILSDGRILGAAALVGAGPSAYVLGGLSGSPDWGPTAFPAPFEGEAYIQDASVGPDGSVYATGVQYPMAVTFKYDGATGAVLWGPVTSGTDDVPETSFQILGDAAGNAIFTGYGGGGVFVRKLDGATGAQIWTRDVGFDDLERELIDANGDVVVVGNRFDPNTLHYQSATIKVSGATGVPIWGPVFYGDPNSDVFGFALAIAPSGDVLVVGRIDNGLSSWFAAKYSGTDGSQSWVKPGLQFGQALGASADAAGDFFVTGQGDGMTTLKLAGADGTTVWGPVSLVGSQPYIDQGVDVVTNSDGDVFVSGTLWNAETSSDIAVAKYKGQDGTLLWGPRQFDGPSHLGDGAYILGLGLDGDGNVVVGGTSTTPSRSTELVVLKYDGATGGTLWGPRFSGTAGRDLLYGFGVLGDLVVGASLTDGEFFLQAWNEQFGIETTPQDLPFAYCGQPLTFAFSAQNGSTPYSWTVSSGALPAGVSLSSTGILGGAAVESGTFAFQIQVQDAFGNTATRDFTLTVLADVGPFTIQQTPYAAGCGMTLSLTPDIWTSVTWLPGGETTPTIGVSPQETTTYGALVADGSGCVYQLSVTIFGTLCGAPTLHGILPGSGPAEGTPITIEGTNFEAGVAVTVGDLPAADVVLVDPTHITATTPALTPGSLYDVTIVNPDSGNAAALRAFFADFLDVPGDDPFHDYIWILVGNGITAGCGGGNYCPLAPVSRAQMAVFLVKSKYGSGYVPPPPVGLFNDVPVDDPFAPWIEQLFNLGVTAGCSDGYYCPADPVTRAQMAVFLLKTRNGSGYAPPPAQGIFGDVPVSSPFAPWVERIYVEGITGGCSASPLLYCPGSSVTRGQMAPLLKKTFDLIL